jgi:hypothetical protein
MAGMKPPETEKQFQSRVIDFAHLHGWMIGHFRTSMNASGGFQTAVGADGKGFPDLTLVHPKYGILFRELKTDIGKVSPEQREWGNAILAAGGNFAVWRPRHWAVIVAVLSNQPITT